MPFKSESQRRLFFAAATSKKPWRKGKRPEISLAEAKEWAHETEGTLPERVKIHKKLAQARLRRKKK